MAFANGSLSHVHISEVAVAALAPGELKSLMMVPANTEAYRAGSMFPDSGYAIDDAYGESAHWSPFLMAFLEDIKMRYGGDYGSAAAQREVAFLLGVASHGLGDQIYDTTLLARAFEVDGPEDSTKPADVYADYFLIVDQAASEGVEAWAPYSMLPRNFASVDGHEVSEETLMRGMQRMQAVIDLQLLVANSLYFDAWAAYPWLGTHIYNASAVGSLPWTGELVARYWNTLWRRLQGSIDLDRDLLVATHPEDGSVNCPVASDERGALGKVALVLGYGTSRGRLAERIIMRPVGGESIDVGLETAYDGEDRNLFFVIPDADLAFDTEYEVLIAAGLETLSGDTTREVLEFSFRTRCAPDRLEDCPELPPGLVTGEIPSRPSRLQDGGGQDAGTVEASSGGGCGGCSLARLPDTEPPWIWGGLALALLLRRRAEN